MSGHGRAFIGLAPLQPGGAHRFEFDTCRTTIRAGARRIPVLISIHAVNNLPRWVSASLAARLKVMPAVILTGARQTGKRTLAEHLVDTHRRFASLDDLDILDLARRDPQALLGGERPMTLAEVQREPDVLRAVKRSIDRNRTPGRILRTGSANLLLMRGVSESLAGRARDLTLWPMTRREQLGHGRCGVWEALLETPEHQWEDILRAQPEQPEDWKALALRGGFPTPALTLHSMPERSI